MAGQGKLFKLFSTLGNYRNLLTNRICVAAYPQQQNAGLKMETKDRLKALKIPEEPKRPLTPYFRFLAKQRLVVQQQHPDWKLIQVTKQCAEDWRAVDAASKEHYQQEYQKEAENFGDVHKKYTASLTKEQSEALKMAKKDKQQSKKQRVIKKLLRENSRPKRPITSFLYFIKDKWELAENKGKKLMEMLIVYKDEWKTMTEQAKEPYVKLQQADKARYEREMLEWETKMVEEGKTDIIRKDRQVVTSMQLPPQVTPKQEPAQGPKKPR